MCDTGKLCSKFREDRSINNVTILSKDTGHWTLDTGHWTVDTGQWTLDTGQCPLDTGQWTLDSGHRDCIFCPMLHIALH